MKKILRSLALIFGLIFILTASSLLVNHAKNGGGIVRAFGDLEVTFPSVPMFNETNWHPGKSVTKSIKVKNAFSTAGEKVLVGGVNITHDDSTNPLSTVLTIIISQNGTLLYGEGSPTGRKTLTDFFSEPAVLSTLRPGEQVQYDFLVAMDIEAGNEFQDRRTIFDLTVGGERVGVLDLFAVPTLPPVPTIPSAPRLPEFPNLP